MISTRPRNRPFPNRTRSRPVKGSGDNAGKRFRCQFCGFMCRIDRDELGDGSGVNHKTISGDYVSDISTGCPFCGSKNWKRQ